MKTDFIETLYAGAEYYDTVKNSILYVMKTRGGISEHDLQDCINEVFLIAMNKRRILEGHPSIKGWLSVTAQNVA
ncbi:MAG: hypothetical protein FWH20_10580, partial [Oscillospiraceae bacterium]|nr:hypothetical protein [Oscillospiraceae bacterium]